MRRDLRPKLLLLLAPLLTAAAPARPAGAAGEDPLRLAPDGRPGLGAEAPLRELVQRVRAERAEEREFFAGLRGLASDVRLLLAGASESYRAAGYYDLIEARGRHDLQALHAAWEQARRDPRAALLQRGPRARAFARAALDPRFAVRAELASGLELEAREVEAGLALLDGATNGYVVLVEEEARAIARRVDLAASRLRAMRSDLLALRAQAGPERRGDQREPEVDALLAAARGEEAVAARAAVERLLEQAGRRADLMRRALFSTRLAERVDAQLAWRARLLEQARGKRQEALTVLPGTPEASAAPPEVLAMAKHQRVRLAGLLAREGLALDPLDDVLAFVAAHAADFQWGSIESRPLYDRFLFLRGIRHFDHRTLADRRLDAREQEALLAVQLPLERDPRPPADRKDG